MLFRDFNVISQNFFFHICVISIIWHHNLCNLGLSSWNNFQVSALISLHGENGNLENEK